MKTGQSEKLVPLNVMVTPMMIQWIIDQAADRQVSMGNVVRQLIERELHDAILKTGKGKTK